MSKQQDPKCDVKRQATFYSLSFSKYNKRGNGRGLKLAAKNWHIFEITIQLTSG